jgi:hypothetical protein
MKNRSLFMKCLLLTTFAVPLPTGVARAEVRVDIPNQDPGPPFYARIRTGFVPHTDQWAAIVFYRQPGCVPPGFNLLNLFNPPTAFGCTLTVDGFTIYDDVPVPPGAAPKLAKFFGLGAVPVWFVSWPELQSAMADGALTITELAALPSLRVAYATLFRETLQPGPTPAGGGAQAPEMTIVASGPGFFLQIHAKGDPLTLTQAVIHIE